MNKQDPLFNIDILCINCNEMISSDEIDSHSEICTKVTKRVNLMENSNIIDQINFKMERIIQSIEKLYLEMVNERRSYKFYEKTRKIDIEALETLMDLLKKIYTLNSINIETIRLIKDYAISIHTNIKKFSGSPAILIYLERAKMLTKEKYTEMAEIDIQYIKGKNQSKSNIKVKKIEKSVYSSRINEESESTKNYQSQNSTSKIFNEISPKINDLLELFTENGSKKYFTPRNDGNSKYIRIDESNYISNNKMKIDDINSESNKKIQKSPYSQDSYMTLTSEPSKAKSKANDEYYLDTFNFKSPSSNKNNNEELQRQFYTKCLSYKMKMSSNNDVQKVSIALIYKEALDKKISRVEWDAFIEKSMKFPEKYMDLSKLKEGNSKRGVQNRLVEMSQNQDFKQKFLKK